MKLRTLATFLLFSQLLATTAFALSAEEKKVVDEAVAQALPKALEKAATEADQPGGANDQALINKYFGAGIMANFDFNRGGARVKSARAINGIVRVEESTQAQVGFMLEAHKFLEAPKAGSTAVHGPFIGIVMQEANIDTAVIGWMWGFRQPKSTQTLNLGLGLSVSPRAQLLGDGIVEGQSLPTGETEVRYKRATKYGFAIIASFGF